MRVLALLALPLVLLAGCRDGGGASTGGFRLIDVADVDRLAAGLDSTGARAVVVNVWATWCGPCIVEFPEFIRYDRTMDGEQVEVRFLSVDDPSVRPRVVQFLQERGWDEPAYLATSQDVVPGLFRGTGDFWDGSIPTSFIFVDGKVRDVWVGSTTYDLLAARVDRALAAPPADAAASR
jgi:thiol-disulfide isomerase/thioredoxin